MTTILGVKSNYGIEGIVLASDVQISLYEGGEMIGKRSQYKIYHGRNWMITHAGDVDKDLGSFLNFLSGQKRYDSSEEIVRKEIEESLKSKEFERVNKLNKNARKNGVELADLHSFILCTNMPKPEIFVVDEFGNLNKPEEDDFEYAYLGSGSKRVASYIEQLADDSSFDSRSVDIPKAVEICYKALRRAIENDGYTGGPIDMSVMTEKGITPYGNKIKESINAAERNVVEEIKKIYSG